MGGKSKSFKEKVRGSTSSGGSKKFKGFWRVKFWDGKWGSKILKEKY